MFPGTYFPQYLDIAKYLFSRTYVSPGGQRKRWEDNIREWTGLEFGKSQMAVENREKWRKLVAKISVVPQRPSRLRDWWWWCCFSWHKKIHQLLWRSLTSHVCLYFTNSLLDSTFCCSKLSGNNTIYLVRLKCPNDLQSGGITSAIPKTLLFYTQIMLSELVITQHALFSRVSGASFEWYHAWNWCS